MVGKQIDEGANAIANRFLGRFSKSGKGFGQSVNVEKREAAERKATKTKAQKDRSQGRTKLINFKTTESFQAFLREFADHETGVRGGKVTMTALIEEAVLALAEEKGFSNDA